MSHILITGFTPFDGRKHNASWIAATQLCRSHNTKHILHSLRLPVLWGQPRKIIDTAVSRWQPRIVISLGEGKPGGFTLESQARNRRSERRDNLGHRPCAEVIKTGGTAIIESTAPLTSIAQSLLLEGLDIEVSKDAGAYLCEELLYGLEDLKTTNSHVELVVFAHLPPFATQLHYRGQSRQCDADLLQDFTTSLLRAVVQHLA